MSLLYLYIYGFENPTTFVIHFTCMCKCTYSKHYSIITCINSWFILLLLQPFKTITTKQQQMMSHYVDLIRLFVFELE